MAGYQGLPFACNGNPVALLLSATCAGGQLLEPLEEVSMEVDEGHVSELIEALTYRLGELKEEHQVGPTRRLFKFVLPSRGLLGFRTTFMQLTKGTGGKGLAPGSASGAGSSLHSAL